MLGLYPDLLLHEYTAQSPLQYHIVVPSIRACSATALAGKTGLILIFDQQPHVGDSSQPMLHEQQEGLGGHSITLATFLQELECCLHANALVHCSTMRS